MEHDINFFQTREKELHRGVVPFLNCKDYLVSNEMYEIMFNEELEMLVTSPIPCDLEDYYESDKYQSYFNEKITVSNLIYNNIKNRSFKRKESIFKLKKPHKSILDVGAGTGDFLHFCKKKKYDVYGVEPNETARRIALRKGITLYESIERFIDEQYDVITMWHALEHVPNLLEYLEYLKAMLKEDGKLIIAVPNYKSYDAKYYKEYWAAYDVPRHLWHFSQKSIHNLFEPFEMKVINTYPLKYDAFYVSLLSEKYKTGKTNYLNAFKVGLRSHLKAKKTSEYSSLIYEIQHT